MPGHNKTAVFLTKKSSKDWQVLGLSPAPSTTGLCKHSHPHQGPGPICGYDNTIPLCAERSMAASVYSSPPQIINVMFILIPQFSACHAPRGTSRKNSM